MFRLTLENGGFRRPLTWFLAQNSLGCQRFSKIFDLSPLSVAALKKIEKRTKVISDLPIKAANFPSICSLLRLLRF